MWRNTSGSPSKRRLDARTYLNHRIHTNAAHRLRRRAQPHECTLLQGEGGHRRRSCRSLRAPYGLCLGEPSCTPSRPPPQESPNNIGNKSYYSGSNTGSRSSIAPMPTALNPIVTLQQLRFSFSFFHLHSPEGAPVHAAQYEHQLCSLYSRYALPTP